jgi:hypothetical protein
VTDPRFKDVQQLAEYVLLCVSIFSASEQNGILTFFKRRATVIYGIYAFNFSMNLICIKTAFFWVVAVRSTEVSAAVTFWEEKQITPKC